MLLMEATSTTSHTRVPCHGTQPSSPNIICLGQREFHQAILPRIQLLLLIVHCPTGT